MALRSTATDVNAVTKPGVETGAFMRDVRTRGETPLHRAAAYGTLGSIRALIDAGAALDVTDSNGDSPLGWASWAQRDTSVLRLLCFPPHQIHRNNQTMRHNLVGRPKAA